MNTLINTKINTKIPALVQLASNLSPLETDRLVKLFGSSIVALLPFNEAEGLVASDAKGQLNGAYYNVELYQSGIESRHKSVKLNAATSYINLYSAAINTVLPRTEGTIMFNVRFPEGYWMTTAASTIMTLYINGSNRIVISKTAFQRRLSAYMVSGAVNRTTNYNYIDTDNWMHIAVTYNNASFKLYINGNLFVTANGAVTPLVGNFNSTLCVLGNSETVGALSPLGKYSHFTILNKAASEAEMFSAFRNSGSVVFEGDSRTVVDRRYPNLALNLLTKNYAYKNNSVSGSNIQDVTDRGSVVDTYIKTGAKNIIIVWAGVNSSALTAQQLYDGLKSYCLARKTAGFKVIICTEIDAQETNVLTNGWHTKYVDLNTLIRDDHSFADMVADLGAIPELQDATNTTYFNADKIHQTEAGSLKIAECVSAQIQALT